MDLVTATLDLELGTGQMILNYIGDMLAPNCIAIFLLSSPRRYGGHDRAKTEKITMQVPEFKSGGGCATISS